MAELFDDARRFGGYACAERDLFEAFGAWARQPAGPGRQVAWAAACAAHGQAARRWRERIPAIPGVDADELAGTAPDGWGVHQGALGEAVGDAVRAAAAANARTWLAGRYRRHRDAVDRRLDAPTARLLDLAIADLAIAHLSIADLDAAETPAG